MHRLLLLNTDLEIGGTPTVVRELAIRLPRAFWVEIEVACLSSWGPVADQLDAAGVKVHALGARGAWDLPRTFFRLRRLLVEGKFDTLFSFLVHSNLVASLARLGLDVRWFQSIQTTQPRPKWHWWTQRAIGESAIKTIVPSESIARVAGERSGIARNHIVVIPNAIEIANAGIAKPQVAGGEVHVGFIGRLDPVKRVGDLIEAMAFLDSPYRLTIVGDGEERARLERLIREKNLSDRVTMVGRSDSPFEWLSKFDVVVLCSEAEGMPLVPIEAMACGVPVVGTDVDGIRDVIGDGENGLLVPMGSAEGIARGIERVTGDLKLRERLIGQGRHAVEERYSWPRVLQQYGNVLGLKARVGNP